MNLFELKAEIVRVVDGKSCEVLDLYEDKEVVVRLLAKEFHNPKCANPDWVRVLLERYEYEKYIDTDEIANKNTQRLLQTALTNPEVQIDFLDCINSLSTNDQIALLQSMETEYTGDELANILIPLYLSQPNSEIGKYALEILGTTKSVLAFAALKDIEQAKRQIAQLKIAGIRQDNSEEFYKFLLEDTIPYRFCISYPDGVGAQALMFSRLRENDRAQLVAVVIDDISGVKDCFGFNDISKLEVDAIIEKFYFEDHALRTEPGVIKGFLQNAQELGINSYEYICWRNLLADIDAIEPQIEVKDSKGAQYYADFMDKWFMLDGDWTLESARDFDEQAEEKLQKIDAQLWLGRLKKSLYLKKLEGIEVNEIDEQDFLKNIVRRSIYEYYTREQDPVMLEKIEELWVRNV
jgi:hypothetical protein